MTAIGCSCERLTCCLKKKEPKRINLNDADLSESTANDHSAGGRNAGSPTGSSGAKGNNCHVVTAVWNPDHLANKAPANPLQKGGRPGNQHSTPNNANIQSFAAAVIAKQKLEEKQAQAASKVEGNPAAQGPVNPTTSWSEPLKAQLKNKIPRPPSSNSTKQLIHASDADEH